MAIKRRGALDQAPGRHHATRSLAAGVHPRIAQERLGYSSTGVILGLHTHLARTMQQDAAARLDSNFRPVITAHEKGARQYRSVADNTQYQRICNLHGKSP
jgi:hypothetical protein